MSLVSQISTKTCKQTKKCSSYVKKLMQIGNGTLPRYMNPHSGTCTQIQAADKLVRETLRLKPYLTSVAYIGAFPEYYFSLTSNIDFKKESIEELFLFDSSMEQLGKTQFNMSKILMNAQKWYLHMDYNEFELEEKSVDMIVMNDNLNLNFSENLEETLSTMTNC